MAPTIEVAGGGDEASTSGGITASFTVAENSMDAVEGAAGAVLGLITLSDPDADDTHTVEVNDDRFQVIDHAGAKWLTLKSGVSLDFEENETVTLTVTVTDSGEPAESASAEVTIMVTDVNEAPSIEVADGETPDGMAASSTVDENVAGAILGAITLSDPDAGQTHTLSTSDDRFVTKQDAEGGWWLALADGMSLNHEAGATVMVTVTVTDSGDPAISASTDVTITVNDVNEAPVATGTVDTVAAEAGERIDVELDLAALFNDPDAGDADLRYELSGQPSWLSLTTDGRLRGEPPTTGDESSAAHMVTITATDNGGESGSVSFYVIVDDGNDQVTGVNLVDHDGNETSEVEVDENDASGPVLGRLTVDDIDHPMHPHGMHRLTVSDSRFEIREIDGDPWLALKEGVALDNERGSEVQVTVTAVDINGERLPSGAFKGTSDSETFAVVVNNENDGPRAGTIGNWWVTVDDDLEAEDVDKGDWLSFSLETEDDGPTAFPAFTDQDRRAGDTLTYSIRGPSWLEIDEETGHMTNADGAVPSRGRYPVTVTATDSDGQSASATFYLNVALSEPDDNYTDENKGPEAKLSTRNPSYDENSGDRRVATFTVTDDDQDIPDHPFALKTVEVISIVNSKDPSDLNNAYLIDHDGIAATPMRLWTTSDGTQAGTATTTTPGPDYVGPGYAGAVVLSDPIKSGDTWTYHINVMDTDPRGSVDTTRILDYEAPLEEITVTVRAVDGVTDAGLADAFTADTDQEILEIDIGIDDVNERPTIVGATPSNPGGTFLSPGTVATPVSRANQSEDNKILLYINLESLWRDDRDDSDELEFGASSSLSWIDIKYGPGEWSDIIKGPDGETGGGDDLTWGAAPTGADAANGRPVGTAPTGADDDVMVVIVEIDRTERNTQGDRGSFTLTAEDEDRGRSTSVIPVVVTDENELIGDGAVTLSGSAREGSTLRVNFNDNRDLDLAGSATPALVLYTWYSLETAEAVPTADNVIAVTTSPDPLRLTQSHVNKFIRVDVTYYEEFGGSINSAGAGDTDGQDGGHEVTRPVSNTPDDGVGHFTITASANTLTVAARVVDEDYDTTAPTITRYQWQVSDNGRGGWEDVVEADPTPGGDGVNEALADTTLTLDDGDGKYYRVVVSYNETPGDTATNPAKEEVASHAIQVADVRDTALDAAPTFTAPTITGSPFPGGTLSVEGRGISSVQWQRGVDTNNDTTIDYWVNMPGATGDLTLTSAHAGSTVRAVVSYDTTAPGESGVTVVTPTVDGNDVDGDGNTTENGVLIGGNRGTARPTAVDDHEITVSVTGSGHAARVAGNGGVGEGSGVTVSVSEKVDLASLFQDPDTAASRLSFSAAATTNGGLPSAATGTGRTAVFQNSAGVLVMEPDGTLTYVSDQLRGHDGNPDTDNDGDPDGDGNILSLDITANDGPGGGTSANTAAVTLRINVAPTAIEFAAGPTSTTPGEDNRGAMSGSLDSDNDSVTDVTTTDIINGHTAHATETDQIIGVTVNERVTATGTEVLATIDVQDENSGRHPFGSHEVTVTGDERFVITNTGPTSRDSDLDGSTWELQVVRGSRFDYETDDMDPRTPGTQIVLTLTATDGGSLSTPIPTPGSGYTAIRLVVTVANDTRDDPRRPGPKETPGLKDDEGSTDIADDDDTTDSNDGTDDDTDTDGGDPTPPPPGTSIGLIEDFVGNMEGFEQDILEDFMLIIDDGIDIA